MRIVPSLVSVLLAFVASRAEANMICVDTSAELTQAFVTAANDFDDTDIRIVAGTYTAPAGGWVFNPVPFEQFTDLSISGGWQAGGNCSSQLFDSTLTKLSGADSRRLITIHRGNGNTGELSITRLSLVHGFSASEDPFASLGLALWIDADLHTGPVLLEHLIVRDNSSLYGRNVVFVSSKGTTRFRNNLVVDNGSGDGSFGVSINALSSAYITGNTIANNAVLSAPSNITGLRVIVSSGQFVSVMNNIIWDNGAGTPNDVDFESSSSMILVGNAIKRWSGTIGVASTPPVSANPKFVSASDYRLAADSPLHDIGVNSPFGEQAIADLAGEARMLGSATDLGAYETAFVAGPSQPDAMFKNGFE